MKFGDRIRILRQNLGLTQDELAQRVGYKSRSTINKIEKNERDATQSMIVEFAKALQTTPSYLMGWEDDENEKSAPQISEADAEMFKNLTDEQREQVRDYMLFLKSKQ